MNFCALLVYRVHSVLTVHMYLHGDGLLELTVLPVCRVHSLLTVHMYLHGDGLLELAALLDLEHEVPAVDVLHHKVQPVLETNEEG